VSAAGPAVEVHPEADTARRAVADRVARLLQERGPRGAVLALPTGETPRGLYTELLRRHREQGLSFAHVTTFGLDEYWPLPKGDPRGFAQFLDEALLDPVGQPRARRFRLDGSVPESGIAAECARYEAALRAAGGMDLLLLGLGKNGHIAFCEPGSARDSRTRKLALEASTMVEVAKAFDGAASMPRHALSIGIATLLQAREIVLMAFGAGKAQIVARALEGPIGPECPASFLREHPRTTFVLDRASAAGLRRA
jgi:glucosamine-6-phosphate deaminase